MARMFGTDGVRGKANVELTPELAYKARALPFILQRKMAKLAQLYWYRYLVIWSELMKPVYSCRDSFCWWKCEI